MDTPKTFGITASKSAETTVFACPSLRKFGILVQASKARIEIISINTRHITTTGHNMNKLLAVALWALAATHIAHQISEPDLWWHITVGRWILSHGTVPDVDYWNFFGAGKPWLAYSWSMEALLAFAYNETGPSGLIALNYALAGILVAGFFCFCGYFAKSKILGPIFGAVVTAGCINHYALRPQSLSWLLFAWILVACQSIADKKRIKLVDALSLLLAFSLWANTNITFIIGLVGVALWLFDPENKKESLKTTALALSISVIGTLITPYLGREWLTFFSKADHPLIFASINEFQPATIYEPGVGILVIFALALALLLHKAPSALPITRLMLGLLLSSAGLFVVKFLPFAIITITALSLSIWGSHRRNPKDLGNFGVAIEKLEALFAGTSSNKLLFLLLIPCLLGITLNVEKNLRDPFDLGSMPASSVDFIKNKQLPLPIAHMFGDGGYVMFRYTDKYGEPSFLVRLDGRTNVNDPNLFKLHEQATSGLTGWQAYFQNIGAETIVWRNRFPLIEILLESPDWCRVFAYHRKDDDLSGHSVFVKRAYFEEHRNELVSDDCK